MVAGVGAVALRDIITFRCGSVSLMGLGLVLVGLVMAASVTALGQVWAAQQNLQDALDNAVSVMQQQNIHSAAQLISLVDQDGELSGVQLISFSPQGDLWSAAIQAPIHLWFWPTWLGSQPITVDAAT